ncbi:MAG: serine/threonine-protein kinase [Gammaproteobacteria bacterium]|nr:serine/threonine-protein kinase [Gammaproteobacteria bacterium]
MRYGTQGNIRGFGEIRRRVAWLTADLDKLLGVSLVAVVVILSVSGGLQRLEWRGYDLGMALASDEAHIESIVIVAVDAESLESLGSWPVSRHSLAEVTRIIEKGNPKSIGYAFSLSGSQNAEALQVVDVLRRKYGNDMGKTGNAVMAQVRRSLDTDTYLASRMRGTAATVLSMPAVNTSDGHENPFELGAAVTRFGIPGPGESSFLDMAWLTGGPEPVAVPGVSPPLATFAEAAAAIGVGPPGWRDIPSTVTRELPLALRVGDVLFPTFSLQLALRALDLSPDALSVEPGRGVLVNGSPVSSDRGYRIMPFFYQGRDGESPFKVASFLDVRKGQVSPEVFAGRTVVIGLTEGAFVPRIGTPGGQVLTPVEIVANIVTTIVNNDQIVRPAWMPLALLLTYFLVAAFLAMILPRLGLATGLLATVFLALVVLNTQLLLMVVNHIWIPLMAPLLAILGGYALMTAARFLRGRSRADSSELSEANFLLAQALEAKGQLEDAFARYQKCEPDEAVLDRIYHLGLDYERKRQFGRASEVFGYIGQHRSGYKDIKERIARNDRRQNSITPAGVTGKGVGAALIIGSDGMQKPMLGRYRIDRELGKGEMGVVYMGHDPKIGRKVAIKTMALSNEFDGQVLNDVQDRFLREASTAGRLNHPNIVTIYDVGEDQGLSYIAMDFLDGVPVSEYTKPDVLLPLQTVLKIGIQVASALEAAHRENIVHRDIKPANILYDKKTGVASVTDFGVACITDTSKTKTGVILGTPAFMSPEQLTGRKVDGRSDIFSLGVTLFQLLTGQLPWAADSISTLMYRIANEPHGDVRKFRSGLPECVSVIMNKALQKGPDARYERAGLMGSALRRCLQGVEKGSRAASRKPPAREIVLG